MRLARVLREAAGGAATVEIPVAGAEVTVGAVLDELIARHPGVAWRLRDEQGGLRPHVNVFVNTDNIRDLGGWQAPVAPGDEISILPAVSGG